MSAKHPRKASPRPHCIDVLLEDMEVRVVWVWSCATLAADQTLTEDLIGPLGLGTTQCTVDVPVPQWERAPESHLFGATVMSVVLLFCEKEFCRASCGIRWRSRWRY